MIQQPSKTSLLVLILSAKVAMTFFAIFVYAKTASFNDTELYLNYGISSDSALNRGAITQGIFSLVNALIGSELVVQVLVSVGCGLVIWYSILPIINRIDMRLFWLAFLMPNFLLRSGYASKEVIGIAGFFVLLRYMILLVDNRNPSFLLHFPLILLAFAVRPHYGLAYAWLLLACFILYRMRRGAIHGMFVHALPVVAAGTILFVFLFLGQYLSEVFQLTLSTAEQYFIASGRASSSRFWLHMNDFTDFIANMWWGLPASIIGPLPEEALNRPIFVPLFLEGLFSFLFIFYLVYRCLGATVKDETARRLVLLGLVPAMAMALLIHYPFGVFNPGSAIRYKQNLAPLLFFFPIMFLAVVEPIRGLRRVPRLPAAQECRWPAASSTRRRSVRTERPCRTGGQECRGATDAPIKAVAMPGGGYRGAAPAGDAGSRWPCRTRTVRPSKPSGGDKLRCEQRE